MSVMRFPHPPESSHPQYLWNEHEYILRMLTQNKIGLQVSEDSSGAITVSTSPDKSLQSISWGGSEIISNATERYPGDETGWVYISPSGVLSPSISHDEPSYSAILQCWHHEDHGRAVIFIDKDAADGFHAIVMDSFNSMFEWQNRIPHTGGRLVYPKPGMEMPLSKEQTLTLPPGRYRFELRGGKGGKGGGINSSPNQNFFRFGIFSGGLGAEAVKRVFALRLLYPVNLTFYKGADGEPGEGNDYSKDGTAKITSLRDGHGSAFPIYGVSGGGGASGEDTYIKNGENILFKSFGGAGGYGAQHCPIIMFMNSYYGDVLPAGSTMAASGPGGGGAGSGYAEQFADNLERIFVNDIGMKGGTATGSNFDILTTDIRKKLKKAAVGNDEYGGEGGQAMQTINNYDYTLPSNIADNANAIKGENGEDISVKKLRKGGDSKNPRDPRLHCKGGDKALAASSSSYLRVYQL